MSIQSLHQQLQALLVNQSLVLDQAILDGVDFSESLGATELEFEQIEKIDLVNSEIVFSGKTTIHHIRSLTTHVSIKLVNGEHQFVIICDLLSNFQDASNPGLITEGDYFLSIWSQDLLELFHQQVSTEKPLLVFSTNHQSSQILDFEIVPGLSLLWEKTDSVSATSEIVSVPVTYVNGQLVTQLLLQESLTIGDISIKDIELTIKDTVQITAESDVSQFLITARLETSELSLQLTGRIDLVNFDITLTGQFQGLTLNSLIELTELTGVADLSQHLPQGFQQPADIELDSVKFVFNPISLSVISAAISIKSNQPWSIIANRFSVSDIVVDVEVKHPFDPALQLISVELDGLLQVAGKTIVAQANFPDFDLTGSLEPGTQLSSTELLNEFAPAINGIPTLVVSDLTAHIAPLNNAYRFLVKIDSDWLIDLGFTSLSIRELSAQLTISPQQPELEMTGLFQFAGVDFLLKANFPEAELSGELYDYPEINIWLAMEALVPNIQRLPLLSPELSLITPRFQINPLNGAFEFSARCIELIHLQLGPVNFELNDVSVLMKRSIPDDTTEHYISRIEGSFALDSLEFSALIQHQGEIDNWQLAAQLQTDDGINLATITSMVLPDSSQMPIDISGIGISGVSLNYDFSRAALNVDATTNTSVQLNQLGSVNCQHLSINVYPAPALIGGSYWKISINGGLALSVGVEIQGDLEIFYDERGSGLSFIPEEDSSVSIPLPLPAFQDNQILMELVFGNLEISSSAGNMSFSAAVGIGFQNLPDFFQQILPDQTNAIFSADNSAFSIYIDRLFDGIEFALPPIPIPDGDAVELGSVRFDLVDLSFLLGDVIEVSASLGTGIPSELNYLFGTKESGDPEFDIFNTYDTADPNNTLVRFRLSAGSNGVSFSMLDSPFSFINFETRNAEVWCVCDFADYGAMEFMLPLFSLDAATSSFKAAGGIAVTRPLKIPLTFLTDFLRENGQPELAQVLPQYIEPKSVDLLTPGNKLRVEKFLEHLQGGQNSAVTFPDQIVDALHLVKNKVDKLPSRLLDYFSISVPDALSFHVAITPDGGVTLDLAITGDPIRALVVEPYSMSVIGFELRGFSFGELLSGQLFLVKADFTVDYFDLYSLAAAFLPPPVSDPLPDSRSLMNTVIVRNLSIFISYQTQVPIPVPLFFDELGFETKGIHGFELQTHVSFPQPSLNPMEMIQLLSEFVQFVSDENYLLDPDLPLDNIDPTLTLGANFLALPDYLGADVLGTKGNLATFSTYQLVAHLLNGIKSFSVKRMIKAIPIEYRVGNQGIEFFGIASQAQWLITTPEEFSSQGIGQLSLDSQTAQKALELLPGSNIVADDASADDDGLVMFLNGTGQLQNQITVNSLFAVSGKKGQMGRCGFELTFDAVNSMLEVDCNGQVSVDPTAGSPFALTGQTRLNFLNSDIFTGNIDYDANGLTFSGQLNLFPINPIFQVQGQVSGMLSNSQFNIAGNVICQAANYFSLSGASIQLSREKIEISGTYWGQSVILGLAKIRRGVELSAGLSPLGVTQVFEISGPSVQQGPLLSIRLINQQTPVIKLTGTLSLLGMQNNTVLTLTSSGYAFNLKGLLFGSHAAKMDITTANELLNVQTWHIKLVMQPEFLNDLKEKVNKKLKFIALDAQKVFDAAQSKLDSLGLQQEKLQGLIEAKLTQLTTALNKLKEQAEQTLSDAGIALSEAQTQLNELNLEIQEQLSGLIKAVDDAQQALDSLNDQIKTLDANLKSLRDELEKTPLSNVIRRTELGTAIALGETSRIGLLGLKKTKDKALDLAEQALELAQNGFELSFEAANQAVESAIIANEKAQTAFDGIETQLAKIQSHPALVQLRRQLRKILGRMNVAQGELKKIAQQNKTLKKLINHFAKPNAKDIVTIKSATYTGDYYSISDSIVSLTITYTLFTRTRRTLVTQFDFINLKKSHTRIVDLLIKQIKGQSR